MGEFNVKDAGPSCDLLFKQLRKGTRSVDREPDSRARSHRITGPGELDVFGGHSKRFSSWLMNDNFKLPNEIAAMFLCRITISDISGLHHSQQFTIIRGYLRQLRQGAGGAWFGLDSDKRQWKFEQICGEDLEVTDVAGVWML